MRLPGKRLREIRERLRLKYRDVEEASQWIANQYSNHAYLVGISRLADIEHKGTIPSIYRLYSLCTIYRIEYHVALSWYGVLLGQQPADSAHFGAKQTQPFDFRYGDETIVNIPTAFRENLDFRNTDHLSQSVRSWGKLPLTLIAGQEGKKHRYAFVGTEDWSMFPIIPPGSFIQLDEKQRRIAKDGWTSEFDRPIYFVEHRGGFKCGWCSQNGNKLVVQPHYSSSDPVAIFDLPGEAEIIGQVIGVAMRLDLGKKRHTHS